MGMDWRRLRLARRRVRQMPAWGSIHALFPESRGSGTHISKTARCGAPGFGWVQRFFGSFLATAESKG